MRTNIAYSFIFLLALTGCQSNYYSEKDFPAVNKVDAHIHLFTGRTIFVEQAVKDNFRVISMNVDTGDLTFINENLNISQMAVQKYPGRFFYAPAFFFDTAGWEKEDWSSKVTDQIQRYIAKGAVSVKFWKNIGMTLRDRNGTFIMIDNPKLDPVIDFIAKNNLPVTGHLGEPRNCWLPLDKMTVKTDSGYFAANPKYHMFLHPEYPSYEAQIDARDNMLEKHPDLQFIGCHLASLEWSVDELAKRLDRFPNMSVDMAERIVHLQYQSVKDYNKVRNFFIKYQDRILYATDMIDDGSLKPDEMTAHIHDIWTTDWLYLTSDKEMTSQAFSGKFKALHLPKEIIDKIYRDNAYKCYKLTLK